MKKLYILVFCLIISSCTRDLSANSVVSTDEAGIVNEGTIVSVRVVQINENDSLDKNGIGMLGGGIVGGIAGHGVGGGTGQNLATAGGAIAGATLGAAIQQELGKSQGYEYIVKLEGGNNKSRADYRKEEQILIGGGSVKDKLKKTINTPDTESSLISVVQSADTLLQAGQRVYVIYSTDRIRLVPAN